ncbi:MAG: hypothetical protein Q8O76_02540 [Chloroflexota bacterium]|nr:hypothetical protein [Chloroflexota bacterium]
MSSIAQALESYKQQVLKEAQESLNTLRASTVSQADSAVNEALGKLELLVKSWEEASRVLQGFSISSAADIMLAGGVVWAHRLTKEQIPPYHTTPTLLGFLHELERSVRSPDFRFDQEAKRTYDLLVLLIPVREAPKDART